MAAPATVPAPAPLVAQANAFYETGAASTSFFVARPDTPRPDRLPDKILKRGTVVQVLAPEAGAGWSKVKLADAQTGYVLLADIDIVAPDVRLSGFPSSGIDTGASLEIPEPPTASPGIDAGTGRDLIDLDEFETPAPSPIPSLPETDDPGETDSFEGISLDEFPGQ